jgi:hypothetical protein
MKENTETLLEDSRGVGLEINAEKTKYMIMSRHPNSGQNQNIRIAKEQFQNMAKFKHLGTTLINQNDYHDETKRRLDSGKACYHSVQNILSSCLIQKKEIKIYNTVIFSVVLYGYETLSLTLREDNIKMDLREIQIEWANWIWLAQDRVQWRAFVSTVMNV